MNGNSKLHLPVMKVGFVKVALNAYEQYQKGTKQIQRLGMDELPEYLSSQLYMLFRSRDLRSNQLHKAKYYCQPNQAFDKKE